MGANCNYESLLTRKVFCTEVKQHRIKVAIGWFKSLLTTTLGKLTTILTTTDFNYGERGQSVRLSNRFKQP